MRLASIPATTTPPAATPSSAPVPGPVTVPEPKSPLGGKIPKIVTYDANHGDGSKKTGTRIVRTNDEPPVAGNDVVNRAHENAQTVVKFYAEVLGRNSINDRGQNVNSYVNYQKEYMNAFWDGREMVYGDGGKLFKNFADALDVAGHEITHGVTEHTAKLKYYGQPGALNESFSDVFGEAIEQWHDNPKTFATPAGARASDWLIGEDLAVPETPASLRDMKNPHSPNTWGMQPASMAEYVETRKDHGGVHTNSSIPNKAAADAAMKIGTEKVVRIWYDALVHRMKPTTTFEEAAAATVESARALYGDGYVSDAVRSAWRGVGLYAVQGKFRPQPTA